MNNEERLESKIKEVMLELCNTAVKEILWQHVKKAKLVWDINYATEKAVTLVFPKDFKKNMEKMSFFNLKKELAKIEFEPHFKPC